MAKRQGAHAHKVKKAQDNYFFSPFTRKHWRSIVAILVAVVVIAGVWLVSDYIVSNKYRIKVKDGVAVNTQPGDIIINRGTTSKPRCFKIATFDVPDTYPIDEDYSITSDKTVTDWAFRPSNGDNVSLVFVRGMKTSAKESHETNLETVGQHDENGNFLEEDQVTIGKDDRGLEYYAYLSRVSYENNGDATYYLRIYLESGKDSAVLISVNSRAAKEEDLASFDTLMAYAKEFMARITPVK
ncbi:MAG: hypothetical protein K5663_08785 [Clostridiales bacterium]|nr:hypothetical protein [Clostridiales bacterium]